MKNEEKTTHLSKEEVCFIDSLIVCGSKFIDANKTVEIIDTDQSTRIYRFTCPPIPKTLIDSILCSCSEFANKGEENAELL